MDIPLFQKLSEHYFTRGLNGYIDSQERVASLTGFDGLLSRLHRGDHVFIRNSGWYDLIKPNTCSIDIEQEGRKRVLTLDAVTFLQVDNPSSYLQTKDGPAYIGQESRKVRGIKGVVGYQIQNADLPNIRTQRRF